ncbi:hypothetical protein Plhal304r1_c053g0138061 [Plasmopara halstedii]
MVDNLKAILHEIQPPLHRRHTFVVQSSPASSSAHSPNIWRPVMPKSRRSTLVAGAESTNRLLSSSDSSMRTIRSLSDAPTPNTIYSKSTFALHNIDVLSVQRAKVIRHVNDERFVRICNYFESHQPELAKEIQAQNASSREQLYAWINYIVSPKVLNYFQKTQESRQNVLDLIMVAAAISKYGESELISKDSRGELGHQDSETSHTMDFVLRLNEQLGEEKRVGSVVLCEVLAHARTMTVEKKGDDINDDNDQHKELVTRVQSEWFQEAMVKSNGRYLYDSIRQYLTSVSNPSWDVSKDRRELRRERLDQVISEVVQEKMTSQDECQKRLRRPPPPPPRLSDVTMAVPVVTCQDTKMRMSDTYRSLSLSVETIEELNVETVTLRRKLIPLEMTQVSRGLPPKLPQPKLSEPSIRTSSSVEVKVYE